MPKPDNGKAGHLRSGTVEPNMTPNGYIRRWWKEAVVYQIYPRSFYDSNGDGIGDLRGLLDKLPHILDLGVDVIWLSPHFDSPNRDNGYDIRDYRKVGADYGTMADFDALMTAVKAAGKRLIIDLVVNHTSCEHSWFVESRTDAKSALRDYYIWHKGDTPPNDWTSIFGGSAWTRDEVTKDWYLHLFDSSQPDLNWDNLAVRDEVYDLMRFWLDKGIDGFRMDVISFISKDKTFPNLAAALRSRPQYAYTQGPHLHQYLQEMHKDVLSHYDITTVGEAFGVTLEDTPLLIDERRCELDMIFQFEAVEVDRDQNGRWKPWTLPELKAIFTRQDKALDQHCWPTVFLSNHDNPRIVSRFGNDSETWRIKSAQVLACLILTLKGTPFLYQGDEFGLTNLTFSDIDQTNDVWTRNAWRDEVLTGKISATAFFANQDRLSRDHARAPIPWTAEGGFTTGTPWFALNPKFSSINAQSSEAVCLWYKDLIALRHRCDALIYGDYCDLCPDHPHVFAYTRTLKDEAFLILLNFSEQVQILSPLVPEGAMTLELTNYKDRSHVDNLWKLRGWEACIYRL